MRILISVSRAPPSRARAYRSDLLSLGTPVVELPQREQRPLPGPHSIRGIVPELHTHTLCHCTHVFVSLGKSFSRPQAFGYARKGPY